MISQNEAPETQGEVTLQSALNQIMVITMILVIGLTFGALFTYSEIKQSIEAKSVEESLVKTSERQIENIVPSFLVPELKSSVSVLLERYKEDEGLTKIEIIDSERKIPDDFKDCKTSSSSSICLNSDKSIIAALVPIKVGDRIFGHLLKAKKIQNVLAHDHTLQMIEAAAGALILFSMLFFVFLSRITSKKVPNDLNDLVTWLESVLEGRTTAHAPRLRFQELNKLGTKIGELLDRHERSRDRAMIGLLASGVMHDIKTPIHSLVTAQLLVAEQTNNPEKRMKYLENLFKVCTNKLPVIGAIIETTLDGSREIHVEIKPNDLQETISKSVALYSNMIQQREIRIETPTITSPFVVNHDPIQLGRVIANLVKNSIEALNDQKNTRAQSEKDISIQIDTSEVGMTKLILEDSGPGLPENAESVFRLLRGTKPRSSGLGLVVSRKIIQAHEGTLTATHAQVLPGARFEIRIPNTINPAIKNIGESA